MIRLFVGVIFLFSATLVFGQNRNQRDQPQNMRGNDQPQNSRGNDQPQNMRGNDQPQNMRGNDQPQNMRGNDQPQNMRGSDRTRTLSVGERFAVVGIISDNAGEARGRDNSIVILHDKQTNKNVILRVGARLPQHPDMRILAIKRKQVSVGNNSTEVLLTPDSFAAHSTYSYNDVRNRSSRRLSNVYRNEDPRTFYDEESNDRKVPDPHRKKGYRSNHKGRYNTPAPDDNINERQDYRVNRRNRRHK